MNFVTWSIRYPIPVLILFTILMFAGAASFPKLPVLDKPDVEFPVVTITVSYPGVQAAQLESEVTRKVEDAVAGVVGIRHIRSNISAGSSSSIIEFEIGTDLSEALDDVRDALARIRADLPRDANEPIVARVTTSGHPIIVFSVAAAPSAQGLSETELSWFVDQALTRELTTLSGVGKVSRVGGVSREIRVDLDFDRLAALGISAADVSRQLKRVQADFPGGEANIGDVRQGIRTIGTLDTPAQLANLTITLPDGRSERLGTLAKIRDQAADRTQLALFDGKPVIGFEIVRTRGSSELKVADTVRARIAELQKQHPQMVFTEISNSVEYVRSSFHASLEMLVEGALLAVLVVWMFLRDMRATLVAALALPLSIVPTFWVMHLLGYSLNNLTLLALTLVVGVLVDDAIVEIENIVRHLRLGKSPLEAARDAALEIGLAVIATTFTLCAVFIPVAFMGGIPGKFFGPFAFTATVSVLFSLLVARMLTPMLASRFLKPHPEHDDNGPITRTYLRWVELCLHHRKRAMLASAGIIAVSIALAPLIPKAFTPDTDTGYTMLSVELPPGSSLEETARTVAAIRQRLQQHTEIAHIYAVVGGAHSNANSGSSNGGASQAQLTLTLAPREQRPSQQALQPQIAAWLRDIPGVRLSFTSDWSSKLQLSFTGEDPELLETTVNTIERELRTIPNLGQVNSKASLLTPELVIRPIPERAAELGVSTEAIAMVARLATSGDIDSGLAKLNLPNRQLPIRVRVNDAARTDIDLIRMLPVPGTRGQVPLSTVADVSLNMGPAQIARYDRSRNATLEIDLNGQPLGDVMKKIMKLPAMKKLPVGVSQVAEGQLEFMIELFSGFAIAMLVGIICIYFVLALLFHEFLQPLTILSALPPSAAGAMIGLYLFGYTLSVPTLIGILMLMGIVTKNSILLVEYAEMARREHGLSRTEALLEACSKRVRPIVMTTIAMIAGMLPVTLGLSANSDFQSSMGAVVISGLIVSTALSLFVVPVVFSFMDDFQQTLSRRWRKPGAATVVH